MENIRKNLAKIKATIASLNAESVILVAVSKTQPTEKIKEAISCGQTHFGESYLQEALVKIKEIANPNIIWHYIGKIQSKKAKLIVQNFSWVESVESLRIAELLNTHRPIDLPQLNICIQVNISNEVSKSGISCDEILPLAKKIAELPRLKLRGLMAIPAYYKESESQIKPFNDLFLEFKKLQNHGIAVDTLSMGMSDDFEAAIAAGATIVRVGSAIFGSRNNTLA